MCGGGGAGCVGCDGAGFGDVKDEGVETEPVVGWLQITGALW